MVNELFGATETASGSLLDRGTPLTQQTAGNLLSFPTCEEPVPWYSTCPTCNRLENEYQRAILEIHSVVGRRFATPRQKLQELHKWQDIRDWAVKAFYEHKASHTHRAA
jgi:hypothetical protein